MVFQIAFLLHSLRNYMHFMIRVKVFISDTPHALKGQGLLGTALE